MSLAAVISGGTKCEPAETLLLVAANPTSISNSATSVNFAICLMRPSFAAIMNGFRLRRAFLQFSGARVSGRSATRSPALGAYPRLSGKVCQRIQKVHGQRLQDNEHSKIASMEIMTRGRRLMRGRFCCGVHAVLRHFVHSAQWLFLMKSEKLIQRSGAFADRVGFLDRLGHVSLRQNHGFAQLQPPRPLRPNRR